MNWLDLFPNNDVSMYEINIIKTLNEFSIVSIQLNASPHTYRFINESKLCGDQTTTIDIMYFNFDLLSNFTEGFSLIRKRTFGIRTKFYNMII
jgi:hypothetical protein